MSVAYFDAATAMPLHPVARQALLAALDDGWADPERLYTQARRARQLLDAARASAAESLGVRPDELSFTSSGTAAIHAALAGRPMIVHSAIEHSAVLHAAPAGSVAVPVDRLGRLDLDAWRQAVARPGVALAALIAASHEVGTGQPVADAVEACAAAGVPLLVDAAASVPWSPAPEGPALLTASAR